jgi:hypothetical protein
LIFHHFLQHFLLYFVLFSFQANKSLNEFFLLGNPISAECASLFKDAFEANPTLTYYVGPGGPLKKKPTVTQTGRFFIYFFFVFFAGVYEKYLCLMSLC